MMGRYYYRITGTDMAFTIIAVSACLLVAANGSPISVPSYYPSASSSSYPSGPAYSPAPAPSYSSSPAPSYSPTPAPTYTPAPASYKPALQYKPAPTYASPSYSTPSYSAPSYSAPSYSAPSYSAPSYSAPSYSAPSYSAPSYSAPAAAYKSYEPEYAPKPYSFEYSVNDPTTYDVKSQAEYSDGKNVKGFYSLIEADGTKRIVEYTADENGFNAVVKKEGTPTYAPAAPAYKPAYKPAPAYATTAPAYPSPAY